MRSRAAAVLAYLGVTALLGLGIWWVALGASLGQLAERSRGDLTLASDRLISQLQSYRELAVLLADHPTVEPLLTGANGDVGAAEDMLLRMADKTGSLRIRVLDPEGGVVARSHAFEHDATENQRDRPYFRRAMQGGLGSRHGRTGLSDQRSFTFAAPVFGPDRKVAGAVAVAVDLETVETDWRASPRAVFFTDESGVVFISNRSDLLYRTREPLTGLQLRSAFSGEYRPEDLRDFQPFKIRNVQGFELWIQDQARDLPARALHLTQPLPLMNLRGEILVDSAAAEQLALLQALVAVGTILTFGGVLLLVLQRRDAIAERLRIEAAANARLETRVAERTEALRQAQADLVQAGKLTALGQMSAGISHELNQPLMAIRSYAENAGEFLRREKAEMAERNLTRISELAHRMGRIIKNLRAFARQESEPLTRVELGAVLESVLELSGARLREASVEVNTDGFDSPLYVRAGEVRLSQVLLNLVSNALDAMEGSENPKLMIAAEPADIGLRLSIRDTGPGLSDPEKIFDPFYSTKEVGASEGMGLGLSISYGLVQSFGGQINGRNHAEGGAVITIDLPLHEGADIEEAA